MIPNPTNLHIHDTARRMSVRETDLRARQITLELHALHVQEAPRCVRHYAAAAQNVSDAAAGSANRNPDVQGPFRVSTRASTVPGFGPSPAGPGKVLRAVNTIVTLGRSCVPDRNILPEMQ